MGFTKKNKNKFWLFVLKAIGFVTLAITLFLGVFVLVAYVNHRSKLKKEADLLVPPGQMVEIDGHQIHVLKRGNPDSDTTIVFMHGSRVSDESIALEPVYEELDEYNLIYVDRSGYGFSDNYDADKSVSSIVNETRAAVKLVDDSKSYILVAEDSAGISALYWARTYPGEVDSIIGINMYMPEQYENVDKDKSAGKKSMVLAVKLGLHRYAKGIFPENLKSLYTNHQLEVRNALIARGFYTQGMYNEDVAIVSNGKETSALGWPSDIPIYVICSNPYIDPFLHEDSDTLDVYNQVKKQGDEYDPAVAYNEAYIEVLKKHKNLEYVEVSGPVRVSTYCPKELAGLIKNHIKTME